MGLMIDVLRYLPELPRDVRRALLVLSMAITSSLLLVACGGVNVVNVEATAGPTLIPVIPIQATAIPTTAPIVWQIEYPYAVGYTPEEGYLFEPESGIAEGDIVDPNTGQVITRVRTVVGEPRLCDVAPDAPVCQALVQALSTMGIPEEERQDFSSHVLVLDDELSLGVICGGGTAACFLSFVDQWEKQSTYWIVTGARLVGDLEPAVALVAHELFHMFAFVGLPDDLISYQVKSEVVGSNTPGGSCVLLTVDGADVCRQGDEVGTVSCTVRDFPEFEAVVAARTAQVLKQQPIGGVYTNTIGGGYNHVDYASEDMPGVMPRGEVIRYREMAVDYFVNNPDRYLLWIKYHKEGHFTEAFEILRASLGLSSESPEDTVVIISEVNRALRSYAIGPQEVSSYTIDQTLEAVCQPAK